MCPRVATCLDGVRIAFTCSGDTPGRCLFSAGGKATLLAGLSSKTLNSFIAKFSIVRRLFRYRLIVDALNFSPLLPTVCK